MSPSRQQGTLTRWIEDRGFGFVRPQSGNEELFVHISAFPRGSRPEVGIPVSYEVETTADGRRRAVRALLPGQSHPPVRHHAPARPRRHYSSASRPSRHVAGKATALLVIAAVAFAASSGKVREFIGSALQPTLTSSPPRSPAVVVGSERSRQESRTEATIFKCDGRTHCSQMTSCAEAKYFLRNCPGTQMDGDGDGIPCESQWCSSF